MTNSSKPVISDIRTSLICFIVTSTDKGATNPVPVDVIKAVLPRPTISPFITRTSPCTSHLAIDFICDSHTVSKANVGLPRTSIALPGGRRIEPTCSCLINGVS